jgi:DNA-directed RNA polymerase I, II, and III subunit RPABC2
MSDSESELASQASEPEEYSDDEEPQQPRFQAQDNDSDFSAEDSDEDDEDDDGSEKLFKPAIKIGKIIPAGEMEIAGLDSDDEYEDDSIGDIEEEEDDEAAVGSVTRQKQNVASPAEPAAMSGSDDEDEADVATDDEDEGDEAYLQKIDREVVSSYIQDMHPESRAHNYDEVRALANVVRNDLGTIIDELHRTIPVMTKFEKTRILGVRAKQLDDGAQPFITVPDGVVDGYTIAVEELSRKAIPFIVRRPLPNGGAEYWRASDLELV